MKIKGLPLWWTNAIYQCMINELKRFEGKKLVALKEHTSSDRSSGMISDIEVRYKDGKIFEAVEIKLGIPINTQLVRDAYEKSKSHPIRRYYLPSTAGEDSADTENLSKEVSRILRIHGCQVIINGIYPSLKYYLRLLHNIYDFIDNYVENLKKDRAIKYEHKSKWNEIVGRGLSKE